MTEEIGRITLEDKPEWLKVTLPVKRNWVFFLLFSAAMVFWLLVLFAAFLFLIRDVILPGERYAFVFSVIIIVWIVVWLWVGRILWRRWQYYAAVREIMFINEKQLIIRRPVSIWGLTEAFDMDYVRPFYISDRHHCPTFDYGSQKVYFGISVTETEGEQLIRAINARYFPEADWDE
jgi:signal transduction histidine kinase